MAFTTTLATAGSMATVLIAGSMVGCADPSQTYYNQQQRQAPPAPGYYPPQVAPTTQVAPYQMAPTVQATQIQVPTTVPKQNVASKGKTPGNHKSKSKVNLRGSSVNKVIRKINILDPLVFIN